MHTMQVVIIAQLFRVRSVNSHSIKECELSFHQTSYKRYTTMCDIYIIHIQGATVCYIHPPENKREKPWRNHHTCTLPHPAPTRPAIQPQPAHPRVLRIHVTYVHRQTHLRYHSGPCSSWRGSAERKRSSFSCPCLWLLLHGCCAAGKDNYSVSDPRMDSSPHPTPTPSLSSIFPVHLFQILQ